MRRLPENIDIPTICVLVAQKPKLSLLMSQPATAKDAEDWSEVRTRAESLLSENRGIRGSVPNCPEITPEASLDITFRGRRITLAFASPQSKEIVNLRTNGQFAKEIPVDPDSARCKGSSLMIRTDAWRDERDDNKLWLQIDRENGTINGKQINQRVIRCLRAVLTLADEALTVKPS